MSRPAVLALGAAMAMLAPAAPALGHAFYVDQSGDGGTCQVGDPCQTITEAMNLDDPDQGSPDIVVVEPGTYTENLTLDVDRSMVASGLGEHVIEPQDTTMPTVKFGPSTTASAAGFTIRGPQPVVFNGPGRVQLGVFDGTAVPDDGAHVTVTTGAGDPIIDRNTFRGGQIGVKSQSTGSPVIRQNVFEGLQAAIQLDGGSPVVDSDVLTDGQNGISATGADVDATNVTSFGNTSDVTLTNADLSLSSSIIEHPINADPLSTCLITHSAGPALTGGACEAFQLLNAAPGFVDPANGDYHLAPTSPLIDTGDPLSLSGLDLDGEQRVVDGNCDGAAVRDIGADELQRDCPVTPGVSPPGNPPAAPAGDADPPSTKIKRMKVDGRTVTFRFASDEPGSSFKCRLDRKPTRACESPVRYRALDRGRHVFRVAAVDVAKNADPVGDRKRFRIRPLG